MHLLSLSSRHVHLNMKLSLKVRNGFCARGHYLNAGLSSTGQRLLRSADYNFNISLRHTNLSSNLFFIIGVLVCGNPL